MREQNVRMIKIITSLLATFVIYLCVGVSKLLPFFLIVSAIVVLVALTVAYGHFGYALIKKYTQKIE